MLKFRLSNYEYESDRFTFIFPSPLSITTTTTADCEIQSITAIPAQLVILQMQGLLLI